MKSGKETLGTATQPWGWPRGGRPLDLGGTRLVKPGSGVKSPGGQTLTGFGDRGSPTGSTVGFAPVLCKPNMVYTVPPQRRGNPCGCPVAPMGPKTDGPPSMTSGARMLLRICALGVTMSWDEAPRERGRPARTNPGTASPISSTRIDRQRRQGSASAGPMRFPPAGWPAAESRGN